VNPGSGLAKKVVVERPDGLGTILKGTKKVNSKSQVDDGERKVGKKG
jgi:hypothetical protein